MMRGGEEDEQSCRRRIEKKETKNLTKGRADTKKAKHPEN